MTELIKSLTVYQIQNVAIYLKKKKIIYETINTKESS